MSKILFLNPRRYADSVIPLLQKKHEVHIAMFEEIIHTDTTIYARDMNLNEFNLIIIGSAGGTITSISKKYGIVIEAIKLQANRLNIPVYSFGANQLAGNKLYQLEAIKNRSLPVIEQYTCYTIEQANKLWFGGKMKPPFIAKELNKNKGDGVHLVHNYFQLREVFFAHGATDHIPLVLQKFVPNTGDFRVLIINNKVLGVMKRTPTNPEEYRNNFALGASGTQVELPAEVIEECRLLVKELDLSIAGVDVIQNTETQEYHFLECNANPGIEGFEKTTGINVAEHLVDFLEELLYTHN